VRVLPVQRARHLAETLGMNVDKAGICLACLTFVAFPMDSEDEAEVRRAVVQMTPDLWAEGLEPYLRATLICAAASGVEDAPEALRDIAERGARTTIARAAVRHLAWQLVLEMRARRGTYPC
jgi:hypothetical protein